MRIPIAIALSACLVSCNGRRHEAAPVVEVQRADTMTYDDNAWYCAFYNLPSGKGMPSMTAPQSTPLPTFYASIKAKLAQVCGSDQACLNATLDLSLLTYNVAAPPPPEHPYSPKVLQHYIDGVNAMVSFINGANLSALSVRQSLGTLTTVTSNIGSYLHSVITKFNTKKQNLIDSESQKIKALAAPIVGQEMADLADTKQKTMALKTLFDAYTAAGRQIEPVYAMIAAQYEAYRKLEPDTALQLQQIAAAAATADQAGLAKLQQQLVALDASERNLPEQLQLEINRLNVALGEIQHDFDEALRPYADFMTKKGFKRPDVTTVPAQSLASMNGYCTAREDRVREAIGKLVDGMGRRTTALIALAVDQQTRETLMQSAQLNASSEMVVDLNARLARLWSKAPISTTLKLSYLATKYDDMLSFLQMESLCNAAAPPAYLQTSCLLAKPQFGKARDWINKTAPATIRIQVSLMKSANVDATKLAAVSAELAAGQVREAAYDHDVLLHATDLPATPADSTDGGAPWVDESEDD